MSSIMALCQQSNELSPAFQYQHGTQFDTPPHSAPEAAQSARPGSGATPQTAWRTAWGR